MVRTNSTARAGTLSFLLLGAIDGAPASGYDLRRLFQDTPIRSFSDTPGSIYPALRGLERRGFVRASTDRARPLRPRRVYRITPAGRQALLAWVREPVVGHAVERDPHLFGAKFAFMSGRLQVAEIARLATCHAEALRAHVAEVRAFARARTAGYPFSARMALEGGVALLDARLAWVERILHEIQHRRAR